MNRIIKKITVSVLSVLLAAACTGCAEVTSLLEEHNIKIPYISAGCTALSRGTSQNE